jgi:hypothetical protein
MQMNQKIIHLDVFRFHFEEELGNYMYDFLIKDRKLRHGGHINLTKISLEIHNVGITAMKDNSDYL